MSLLQMSFAGAMMILAITVIRALAINLLPKKTFLVLWGIAVARLLLPFSLPSMFSVYSLLAQCTPAINATKVSQAVEVLPLEIAEQIAAIPGDNSTTASAVSMWTVIWAAGVMICATVYFVAYWKCRQEFQTSLPVDNGFVRNWLSTHQLKRSISIRQSSRFSTPLTYGVFRPVILMPTSTKWEDSKSLQYVLTHEYVHIQRFDSITKFVLIVTLCVHWFNPLAWVMYVLANRDIELSCEEAVIRYFGESTKATYAQALISMEETRSSFAPLCSNFSKNAMEERITAIMKYKKSSIIAIALAFALVVGITTAFATAADGTSNVPSEQSSADNNATLVLDNLNAVPPSEVGVQGKSETTIPEQYADIDGSLSYSIGKEEENLNAPGTIGNTTLISVSHDDKRKHTPEEWQQILKMIEEGKVFWSDQPTEFNTAIPVLSGDIHGAPIDKTGSTADGLPENNVIYFDTEAERDEHFRALDANMERGLDRYAGFETMYADIDTSAPITYIVK